MDWSLSTVEQSITVSDVTTSPANPATIVSSLVLDVRQFSSYYALIVASVTGGAATDYNQVIVQFFWYADPQATVTVFQDQYAFFASQATGTFKTAGGVLLAQDQMHGPFMRVRVTYNGPDVVTARTIIIGTTRSVGSPYIREQKISFGAADITERDMWVVPPDFAANIALAAGATVSIPCMMQYGRGRWRIVSTTAYIVDIMPLKPWAAAVQTAIDSRQAVAGEVFSQEYINPKAAPVVQITNLGAIPGTVSFSCIVQDEHF